MMNRLKNSALFGLFLKPLIKMVLLRLIRKEGDLLQEKVKSAIARKTPFFIDKAFDEMQDTATHLLKKSNFIPDKMAYAAVKIISEQGDSLQEKIKEGMAKDNLLIVDMAFDSAQKALEEKINAL